VVQFWAHKEVIFVHHCVLLCAYCAEVVVEDFGAVEVCRETVVARVEPEVSDCLFSGFIFVVFLCRFDVLPLCLVGWGDGFLGKFLLFLFLFFCCGNIWILNLMFCRCNYVINTTNLINSSHSLTRY
jgi:hypothetical protein